MMNFIHTVCQSPFSLINEALFCRDVADAASDLSQLAFTQCGLVEHAIEEGVSPNKLCVRGSERGLPGFSSKMMTLGYWHHGSQLLAAMSKRIVKTPVQIRDRALRHVGVARRKVFPRRYLSRLDGLYYILNRHVDYMRPNSAMNEEDGDALLDMAKMLRLSAHSYERLAWRLDWRKREIVRCLVNQAATCGILINFSIGAGLFFYFIK